MSRCQRHCGAPQPSQASCWPPNAAVRQATMARQAFAWGVLRRCSPGTWARSAAAPEPAWCSPGCGPATARGCCRSTPASSRCVAQQWRRVWMPPRLVMPACAQAARYQRWALSGYSGWQGLLCATNSHCRGALLIRPDEVLISDRAELVVARVTLRQAQGERFKLTPYSNRPICTSSGKVADNPDFAGQSVAVAQHVAAPCQATETSSVSTCVSFTLKSEPLLRVGDRGENECAATARTGRCPELKGCRLPRGGLSQDRFAATDRREKLPLGVFIPLGLSGRSSMAELLLPKQIAWVRFPSPAPFSTEGGFKSQAMGCAHALGR